MQIFLPGRKRAPPAPKDGNPWHGLKEILTTPDKRKKISVKIVVLFSQMRYDICIMHYYLILPAWPDAAPGTAQGEIS